MRTCETCEKRGTSRSSCLSLATHINRGRLTPCRLLFYTEASGPPSAQVSANVRVRAFRGLQSGGSSRANEPRPQKHSRGRDPLAPAGPESSRDSHGRSWGRVWISTRGSPRYARGRARLCDSASTRRPNARCARLSPRRVRICGDPEEAPRTRLEWRAHARSRVGDAHRSFSRNARPSNRERVSLTLHASCALPSSPVFTKKTNL